MREVRQPKWLRHPIKRFRWMIHGWRFDPFPMSCNWNGNRIRIWDDPTSGETLYAINGNVVGPLYSDTRKASNEE